MDLMFTFIIPGFISATSIVIICRCRKRLIRESTARGEEESSHGDSRTIGDRSNDFSGDYSGDFTGDCSGDFSRDVEQLGYDRLLKQDIGDGHKISYDQSCTRCKQESIDKKQYSSDTEIHDSNMKRCTNNIYDIDSDTKAKHTTSKAMEYSQQIHTVSSPYLLVNNLNPPGLPNENYSSVSLEPTQFQSRNANADKTQSTCIHNRYRKTSLENDQHWSQLRPNLEQKHRETGAHLHSSHIPSDDVIEDEKKPQTKGEQETIHPGT